MPTPEAEIFYAEVAQVYFVSMSDRGATRSYIDGIFQSLGLERRIRAESPWASSVCHLVSNGIGSALVLRDVAEEFFHLGYHIKRFVPRIESTALLLTAATRPLPTVANGFRELLLQQHKVRATGQ